MGVRSGVEVEKNLIKQWKALHRLFMNMSYVTRSMINTISIAETLLICLFVFLVSSEPTVGLIWGWDHPTSGCWDCGGTWCHKDAWGRWPQSGAWKQGMERSSAQALESDRLGFQF